MAIFNSVYKSFNQWWQPWANTILYYSFNNWNLNDDSGNGNNWTWVNGTWSFIDVSSGNKAADMDNTYAISIPVKVPTWDFTYSIYMYMEWNVNKTYQALLWVATWNSNAIHYQYSTDAWAWLWILVSLFEAQSYATWSLLSTQVWHHICLTRSWDDWAIYIDWVSARTFTKAWTPSQTDTWYVWKAYTDNRYFDGYLDEVILEDKARTAQEVADYYNITKSNYWL